MMTGQSVTAQLPTVAVLAWIALGYRFVLLRAVDVLVNLTGLMPE